MKNINKQKRTNKLCAIAIVLAFVLALATPLASACLEAEIETDKDNYSPEEPITFFAAIGLTECEQLNSVQLILKDGSSKTCSLPKQFGEYPDFGNCGLDVSVTETNPNNCYTYGGSNELEYEIHWKLPSDFSCGIYMAELAIATVQESLKVGDTFKILCTTTTCPATTTTTLGCRNLWWFDSEHNTTCDYKQFCGAYMYQGLRTFETKEDCEKARNGTPTTTTVTTPTTTTTRHYPRDGGGGSRNSIRPTNPPKIVSLCTDKIKNYGETDVDCGGPCPPCDEGKKCIRNADCTTKYCYEGVCKKQSCSDGIKNQDETDVDCGGSCSPCADGKRCAINADCKSKLCLNNICKKEEKCETPLSCSDGVKNQDETDVDCGGQCKECGEGKACKVDDDCASNYCLNSTCRAPSCTDGIKNQGEKGIDCGGPCKPCGSTGIIGYITAISGDLGNLFIILIILLLLALLALYVSKKRKAVASADFLDSMNDEDLERFVNKKKPNIVAGTSRKLRRLKRFIDEGKVDIIWIKDWDYVNELISKGLDDNNAESIALAKQLKASLYTSNAEAKKVAEEAEIKVYDKP